MTIYSGQMLISRMYDPQRAYIWIDFHAERGQDNARMKADISSSLSSSSYYHRKSQKTRSAEKLTNGQRKGEEPCMPSKKK
jgi:hypothetical protein